MGGPVLVPIAGFSYALLGPAQALNGTVLGRRVVQIQRQLGR